MLSPAIWHEEAALAEPPDVHPGLVRRGAAPRRRSPRPAGAARSRPAAPRRRSPRGGPAGKPSGTGSDSAALRPNAERRPRRVVEPEGKSASGSSAMAARGERSGRRDFSNRRRRPCPTLAAWVRSSAIAPPPAVRCAARRWRRPSSATRWSWASPAAAWPSLPSSPVSSRSRWTRLPCARSGYPRQPEYGLGAVTPGHRGVYLRSDEGLGEDGFGPGDRAGKPGRRVARPAAARAASTSRSAARQRCWWMTGWRPAPP